MKLVLAPLLILLLLLVALPMGMGDMGDCPMCTSAKAPFALELCFGILAAIAYVALMTSRRLPLTDPRIRHLLLESSIFRPPRPV